MSITATCGACGRRFTAPPQFQGKRVKCKGCGEIFTVPTASRGAPAAPEFEPETDPLQQLAAVATSDSLPGADPGQETTLDGMRAENPSESFSGKVVPGGGLTPNVLTFDYPGASDIDQWLPVSMVVLGFLLLLSSMDTRNANGIFWIAATRLLTPSLFYVAFIYPVTLGMIRKAGRELRFEMPPNFQLRCLASYMPAFVILTWMQMGGAGFSFIQLLAGLFGLALSSVVLWLLFRLREENIGTTVIYGAGGFAASAAITVALTLGLNKLGALVVAGSHVESSVPVSPFGEGLSWVTVPPPVVAKVQTPPPSPAPSASADPSPATDAGVVGQYDPGSIPGDIDELIDAPGGSPMVAVFRKDQSAISVESWNTQTWKPEPGILKLPTRPTGNMVVSPDGNQLAWIAEFPRLSVQVWSFSKSSVIYSAELDPSRGHADLIAFVGPDQVLIDRTVPLRAMPQAASQPSNSAAPTPNIFDDMPFNPHQLAEEKSHPADQAPSAAPVDGAAPSATQPASPGARLHQFSVVNVSTGETVCTFALPPLRTDTAGSDSMHIGQNAALSVDTARLAVVVKKDGIPTLIQIDLVTGKSLGEIPISEIDPSLSASPAGLAYSNDSINLAALFENGGSALLLAYNSNTGKKIANFVYPAGPLEGAPHASFDGSAICWLDPIPCWMVYGQGVVSTQTGAHLKSADLNLPVNPIAQRFCADDRLEMVMPTSSGKRLTILKVDRTKLAAALDAANPQQP